ncbi:polyprenyl synthetase family protein [uncultured Treponema sp.]|uniref:polyprenyl synthetase family protein n=1 Tax=uncultured Treponema sp. TaxID=162155 RepID=UPI0025D4F34F|nr:polyprenyl synthetase family protein [uncultured Treponema sp.]
MNNEFISRLQKIEGVLNTFLPAQANPEWQSLSFGKLDSCVSSSHLSNLITPCKTLIDLGGKRWRPLLLVLCAELAADSKKSFALNDNFESSSIEKAYNLTPLVEFAHNASLIHDDIEDCADTRRGKPAAHITYGLDVALNAGSWLYFEAATCIKNLQISDFDKVRLYELFLLELRRLHLGQAMDILWHRNPQMIPSVEEYTAMVRNKTGTLARLAVKLGVFAGGGTDSEIENAGAIAQDIGTGFQIIDDVINLTSGNPGKKRGDDIVEGKKSLPVLIHLEENSGDKEKLAALFEKARNEGIDSPAVEEAISLLTESGAVAKAKKRGLDIISSNSASLSSLFGNNSSKPAGLIAELFELLQGNVK